MIDGKIRVLTAIKEYIEKYGYSPTVREICTITGFRSSSTVHGYLKELKQDGLIYMLDHSGRTITLVKER